MKFFLATAFCSLAASPVTAFAPRSYGSSFVGGVQTYSRDVTGKDTTIFDWTPPITHNWIQNTNLSLTKNN